MRTILLFFVVLFFANGNAQKYDCASKIKKYQDLFLVKKVPESYTVWQEVVKNCAKEDETVYKDGLEILQYLADNATSPAEKEKLVREAMLVYEFYQAYFPKNTADFEVRQAMLLYDNGFKSKENLEEILGLLECGFGKTPEKQANANAVYIYFSLNYNKYKTGDPKITSEVILDKYTTACSLLLTENPNAVKAEESKTALRAIQFMAKDITDCPNLSDYYTKKYDANKENLTWVFTATTLLSKNCSDKPIFITLAEKLYTLEITAQTANYMALSKVKQRNYPEAIQYYDKAAALELDPLEKAKIYYTVATNLTAENKAESKLYITKTLTADPKMGKAYLYLAQQYAGSAEECGKTVFEKKAVWYLAKETALKAGSAEPRLQQTSENLANEYSSKAATKTEIKKAKMKGKSITIGCWINETITFPSKSKK